MAKDFENSNILTGSTSESLNSDNLNGSNSDPSYHNDNDADDPVDEGDDVCDFDDNDDYIYEDDDDDYLSMQAQFDHVDLPPGVEASVSWLNDPAPSTNTPASTSTSSLSDAVGSSLKFIDHDNSKNETAATSSSIVLAESSSAGKEQEGKESDVMGKFQSFKQFDTVDDFSDHHFNGMGFSGQQVSIVTLTCILFSLFMCSGIFVSNLFSALFHDSLPRLGQREFRMSGKSWRKTYLVSADCISFNYLVVGFGISEYTGSP